MGRVPANNAAHQRRTTTTIVVEDIRRQILAGSLEPGDRLMIDELARDLGVSATPVREALYQLAVEGTVFIDPYRGFSVSELSVAEAQDLFETRAVLAAEAARLAAAAITPEALAQLQELTDRLATALRAREIEVYLQWDRAFHAALYAACGRAVLLRHLTALSSSSVRYQRYQHARLGMAGVMEASQAEHRQITEALERRDAGAVEKIVRRHVLSSARWAVHFLSAERDGSATQATGPVAATVSGTRVAVE
jgi:DNA-binding GntR family transcriptional regulator